MDSRTRLKLDMVHRVYALSTEHQSTIAGYVDAVGKMAQALTRADALAQQEEAGDLTSSGSVEDKDEVRRIIREEHLQHLVRIARVSLPEDPGLRARFRMPARSASQQSFVAAIRAMLAEAASRKALFVTEGMPESFMEDLDGLLTRYVQAVDQKTLGRARRVGAGAELKSLTTELLKLVRRLDGINRKRWQGNTELLAAWDSAKDVGWPHVKPVVVKPAAAKQVVEPAASLTPAASNAAEQAASLPPVLEGGKDVAA